MLVKHFDLIMVFTDEIWKYDFKKVTLVKLIIKINKIIFF